jgi:hypothetical protein
MVKKRKNKYDFPIPFACNRIPHTIIADADETTPTVATMMLDND